MSGEAGSVLAKTRMTEDELKLGKARLKLAFALLVCAPGVPCIYYGDEAGCEGYRDPFNRRPYPWGREDGELVEFFKNTLKLRDTHNALKYGTTEVLKTSSGVIVFKREYQDNRILCVFNANMHSVSVNLQHMKLSLDAMSFTTVEY